jgi:hypothetical protein
MGNACYHSVQNLLPFCFLSENPKIKNTQNHTVIGKSCNPLLIQLYVFKQIIMTVLIRFYLHKKVTFTFIASVENGHYFW